MSDKILIEGLTQEAVIGVYDWERKVKQRVIVDIHLDVSIAESARSDKIEDTVDYKSIKKSTLKFIADSEFQLLETLAERLAALILETPGVKAVRLKVSKPGALSGAENVAIAIRRPSKAATFYLGVGSNIEPRENIEKALKLLGSRFEITARSSLYQSPAWGVSDRQNDYLNMALKAKSDKDRFAIIAETRWIETLLGRKRADDKFAARPIDIDLLFHQNPAELTMKISGREEFDPGILENQFIHKPMVEIAPELVLPGMTAPLARIEPKYLDPDLPCSIFTDEFTEPV